MGKIALIFPGQGAQYVGMGKSLYESSTAAKAIFDKAEALLPGVQSTCFEEGDRLTQTAALQPALFTTELACAAALEEAGIYADMTAGFSIGELSALVCAKSMDFENGLKLVRERGLLMGEAAEKYPAFMAAVVKLSTEAVEEVCRQFNAVYPVNFNCPGQVTCAGAMEERDAFTAAVKAAGGRALPLKVQSGFHSPFMNEAADKFRTTLEDYTLAEPSIVLYSNLTGTTYPENRIDALASQLHSPVQWEKEVRAMIADGVTCFIECGPGTTLSGMIGRIDKDVQVLHVDDAESLAHVIKEVSAWN